MIVFRADGNNRIGLGHIMRCLSIADAFKRIGKDCLFIIAQDKLSHIITERGYNCIILNSTPYKLDDEIGHLLDALKNYSIETVIVDSYYVTDRYLSAIKEKYLTVYIDDIYSFAYPVDCIINYAINAKKEKYEELYSSTQLPELLLGTDYVPLRNEFCNIDPKALSGKIKNILVSTGGADSEHIALRLVEYLQQNSMYNNYTFHIVVGAANYDLDKITNASKGAGNITVYSNVSKISNLMCMCDAAISAAGSTLFELCACGLPIVTYTLADNQKENNQTFCDSGIAVSAGDVRYDCDFVQTLLNTADKTFSDIEKCRKMSESAHFLVDGKGAERIIDYLDYRGIIDGTNRE